MPFWPALWTQTCPETSTYRRPRPIPLREPSSTECKTARRTSSPTRWRSPWRRPGALVQPRCSSVSSRHSWTRSPSRRDGRPSEKVGGRPAPSSWIRRRQYRQTHENPKGRNHMNTPSIVSAQEWEAARQRLLVKEKEVMRARDALAASRRRMPWQPVDKHYQFDGPEGRASLLDLFDGRRQLIVYRAFFEPGVHGWPDHACRGCSMVADNIGHVAHLNARDTTLVLASRAPQADIERVKARMGWRMPWYTITDGFDVDFGVDEWHGTNAFIRDGDNVFRTYFINARGDEAMGSTWSYLDMTALGRQEEWEDSPEGYPQTPPYEWWNWHDEYGNAQPAART